MYSDINFHKTIKIKFSSKSHKQQLFTRN